MGKKNYITNCEKQAVLLPACFLSFVRGLSYPGWYNVRKWGWYTVFDEERKFPVKASQICLGFFFRICVLASPIYAKHPITFSLYINHCQTFLHREMYWTFLDSTGERLLCDRFFDDWVLYAVPSEKDYTYSLLKFREQEHDAEDGSAAILATHAGNTSIYSFAAEVAYHARFLTHLAKIKIPFFGRSIYDSAIQADMTVDDKEFEGPAPFYQESSRIVRRQHNLHREQKILSKEGVLL